MVLLGFELGLDHNLDLGSSGADVQESTNPASHVQSLGDSVAEAEAQQEQVSPVIPGGGGGETHLEVNGDPSASSPTPVTKSGVRWTGIASKDSLNTSNSGPGVSPSVPQGFYPMTDLNGETVFHNSNTGDKISNLVEVLKIPGGKQVWLDSKSGKYFKFDGTEVSEGEINTWPRLTTEVDPAPAPAQAPAPTVSSFNHTPDVPTAKKYFGDEDIAEPKPDNWSLGKMGAVGALVVGLGAAAYYGGSYAYNRFLMKDLTRENYVARVEETYGRYDKIAKQKPEEFMWVGEFKQPAEYEVKKDRIAQLNKELEELQKRSASAESNVNHFEHVKGRIIKGERVDVSEEDVFLNEEDRKFLEKKKKPMAELVYSMRPEALAIIAQLKKDKDLLQKTWKALPYLYTDQKKKAELLELAKQVQDIKTGPLIDARDFLLTKVPFKLTLGDTNPTMTLTKLLEKQNGIETPITVPPREEAPPTSSNPTVEYTDGAGGVEGSSSAAGDKKKMSPGVIAAIVVVSVLVVGGGAAFLYFNQKP